ncbi:MAG: putative cytokinetic ring protein SteA [Actinomycetota bacterium]
MVRRARRQNPAPDGVIQGIARLDRRTKRLVGRLLPGEIAVIDHEDLDRVAAEALVERKVRAVVNAAESSSGRYPNLGPLLLLTAGIPLIDRAGPDLFRRVREGERLTIDEDRLLVEDEVVAKGVPLTLKDVEARLDQSKREIGAALEAFAENTLEYMRAEKEMLLEAIRLPEIRKDLHGRHVLVVVRGYRYKEDLASLRRGYIAEFRPVLIGVDGGADALLDLGLRPDIIIGDMDSVTTRALSSGAELVVHAYRGGEAPGKDRLDALALPYVTFESPGTSEDVALLLAHEKGAELIVEVGARASLIELLDKGRRGMASTFLVRLRVGPTLVDAKGVSELHRPGPTRLEMLALVLAAAFTMVVVIALSQEPNLFSVAARALEVWFRNVVFVIRHAIW